MQGTYSRRDWQEWEDKMSEDEGVTDNQARVPKW